MKISKISFCFFVLFSSQIFAVTTTTESEIKHLLTFVANSSCLYERNGTKHSGDKAVEHIQKKYDYFINDIKTTEDFIEHSATRSKISGKYYYIYCSDNEPIKSKDWLLTELKSFRMQGKHN